MSSEIKTALMLCQTVFNFTFNESDIVNNIMIDNKITSVYIYSDNKKCFKYCINFVINLCRPVKVKLFRTGKMSICGLKSLQEHEAVNNIIIHALTPLIPNILIIETKILSGRFYYSYPFTIDLNKIQNEQKVDYHPERFSGLIIRYNGITVYLFKSGKVNFSTNKMALLQSTKDNLDVLLQNYKL